MKYAALLLLLALASCVEYKPVPFKYSLGQKVLLKTGDEAIITAHVWPHRYDARSKPPIPRYQIRVGFINRVSHTDSLLDGKRKVITDITTFNVNEFEIEKVIK